MPALPERILHGCNCILDKRILIVVRNKADTLGQRALHIRNFFVQAFYDLGRILTVQFHDDAGNDLFSAIAGNDTAPDFPAKVDFSDIAQPNRNAVDGLDMQCAQVLQLFDQSDSAHKIFLGTKHKKLPACVAVIGRDRCNHIVKRQCVLVQRMGIDLDLVLQNMAAHRQDFRYAGNGLQLIFHHPVIDLAQIHVQRLAFGINILVSRQIVHENFAKPR